MRRRTFVRGVGAGSTVALAGCFTRDAEDEDDAVEELDENTLRIATYSSMVTGETPAGRRLEEAFLEERPEVELDWRVPEVGVDHFVRRAEIGAAPGADVYLGLTVGELVRVDEALEDARADSGEGGDGDAGENATGDEDGAEDESAGRLFDPLERDRLEHADRVRDDLAIDDPDDRVLPVDTGYLALVYDERDLEGPPGSFADLLEPAYERALLAQDPRSSDPGLAFLLWTIDAYGDGYREFWRELRDNGVRVLESWTDAYRDRYLEGRGSMIVSYSTDRVGAAAADRPLARHRIATLEGEGFRNTECAAVFAESPRTELAYEFLDFVLSPTAQAALADRNVQFPAVADAYVDLEPSFDERAQEPDRTITATYEELRGTLGDRLAGWERAWTDEGDG